MSLLVQISKTLREGRPRRTYVYGTDGIGKSTFAAAWPKPVFVTSEDGLGDIEAEAFPAPSSIFEVFQMLEELYTESHPFETVVLDTVDWLETFIFAQVIDDVKAKTGKSLKSIEDIGYAKGYTFALDYWRALLSRLKYLVDGRGMEVVLLGHADVERFNDPTAESYDRYGPKLHRKAAAILREWADEVLFAHIPVSTSKEETGFGKERTRALGGGRRVLLTKEGPTWQAKRRIDLPDQIDLSFEAYAKARWPNGRTPTKKKAA